MGCPYSCIELVDVEYLAEMSKKDIVSLINQSELSVFKWGMQHVSCASKKVFFNVTFIEELRLIKRFSDKKAFLLTEAELETRFEELTKGMNA